MSPPPSVALLFHGHFHRVRVKGQPWCSDYTQSLPNIDAHVMQPLRRAGTSVHTYFHTYSSGCHSRDAALVHALRPAAFYFERHALPRIVDSYLRVLDLALRNTSSSDSASLVLLRFDVQFSVAITALPLRWSGVNMPAASFPEWRRCDMVSDLFFALARSHARPFAQVLSSMGHANLTAADVLADWRGGSKDVRDACLGVVGGFLSRPDRGGAHFIVPPLRRLVGEAHLHLFNPVGGFRGAFARIERACGPGASACTAPSIWRH